MDEELEVESFDDVVDLFMKSNPDFVESEEEAEDTPEDTEEVEEEEEDEEESTDEDSESEDEPGDEDDDEPEEVHEVSDEAEVVVKVNGEDKKFKVSDLKRLAGQEVALTQKSQSVSSQLKLVETQGQYLAQLLESRWNTAKAEYDKYAKVDLIKASHDLDAEDYEALRDAKVAAESNFQSIDRESREFLQRAVNTRQQVLREQAKESLKVITQKIPGWNDQVYVDVRSYAVSQGMSVDAVNELIDPTAIVMIHKAMQLDKAKDKAKTVKQKVKKAPTRVLSKGSNVTDSKSTKLKAAERRASSGDIDDVAALFLAKHK